jgi:putative membrane protein
MDDRHDHAQVRNELHSTREAAADVAASAGAVKQSSRAMADSADRRTELAADRTVLAAERTYAAWVRTGLASLASGVGAPALLAKIVPDWLAGTTGSMLILFSGFCFVAAIWRELRPGAPPPRPDIRRLPAPLLIMLNGFLLLVALAAIAGVWFGLAAE